LAPILGIFALTFKIIFTTNCALSCLISRRFILR
jgi:hypothetical protein